MDNSNKTEFFYANQAQLATTAWEIVLKFQRYTAQMVPDGSQPPKLELQEDLQVSISPPLAKLLVALLYQQIDSYQSRVNANIPLEEANQAIYDKFVQRVKESGA